MNFKPIFICSHCTISFHSFARSPGSFRSVGWLLSLLFSIITRYFMCWHSIWTFEFTHTFLYIRCCFVFFYECVLMSALKWHLNSNAKWEREWYHAALIKSNSMNRNGRIMKGIEHLCFASVCVLQTREHRRILFNYLRNKFSYRQPKNQ